MERTDQQGQQPTPAESSLLDRYAAADQNCRDIATQVGTGYDENPQWRAAERTAEHLWKQALDAGHTADEILTAAKTATQES